MANWLSTIIKEIRPNAIWDIVKWVVGGVIVITGTLLWQYWQAIPPGFQAVFVIGLMWFIGVPIVYFIVKFFQARKKLNPSQGEIIITAQSEVLKGCEQKIETLEAEKKSNAALYQGLYDEKTELQKTIDANNWLLELAAKQAQNIVPYLQFQLMIYHSHEFHFGVPNMVFFLKVFNVSVFDLTFERIAGNVFFNGKVLKCQIDFSEGYPDTIKAGTVDGVGIELQFGDIQAEAILKAVRDYRENPLNVQGAVIPSLGFSDLSLFVVGDGYPEVKRARWKFTGLRAAIRLDQVEELYEDSRTQRT